MSPYTLKRDVVLMFRPKNVIKLINLEILTTFFYHEDHEGHEEKTKEYLSQRRKARKG